MGNGSASDESHQSGQKVPGRHRVLSIVNGLLPREQP
jgi:hypothetical protein